MKKECEPFLLEAIGKDYIWGGSRLKEEYNKNIDLDPLAETWEASTHKDGISKVASGKYKGKLLTEVLIDNPNYLGSKFKNTNSLPILVKLIDANKDLSVQVHPSDEYAYINENKSLGKNEMWYVLDAKKDSKIVYGFKEQISKERVLEAIKKEELEKYLNKINVVKGDCYFIDSGIVHAIGEGILIAEIQECSNLTYRLYDYNRKDKTGNLRPLHIEKALDVANLNNINRLNLNTQYIEYEKNYSIEHLCLCKYFNVNRINLKSNRLLLKNDDTSFRIILVIEGKGTIKYSNENITIKKGTSIFVPASSCNYEIEGTISYLDIYC